MYRSGYVYVNLGYALQHRRDLLGSSFSSVGALFENFVVMNLLKLSSLLPTPPYAYHWRTDGGAEVNLIFERDGKLFPIEIKCKGQLNKHDTRGLRAFYDTYPSQSVMPGLIIYAGNEGYQIDDNILAIPWNAAFMGG